MRLIDGDKLLEWLESEIASTSPADYVTAMKWASYNIDKGNFDIAEDTGIQSVRDNDNSCFRMDKDGNLQRVGGNSDE